MKSITSLKFNVGDLVQFTPHLYSAAEPYACITEVLDIHGIYIFIAVDSVNGPISRYPAWESELELLFTL